MKKNKNNIKTARLQRKLQREACDIAIKLFNQTYPHTHTLINARVRWFAYPSILLTMKLTKTLILERLESMCFDKLVISWN